MVVAAQDPADTCPDYGAWAAHYQRYRPGYPQALFTHLRSLLGPRPRACAELGAGSGQATGDLARLFDTVTAVEPDALMAALIPPAPGVSVIVQTAETVTLEASAYDAVVAATAFHWMDQVCVARRAAEWLKPGGVLYVFAVGKPQYPQASAPLLARLQQHQTAARAHMHDRIASWRPYDEALRDAGVFAQVAAFEFFVEFRWSLEEAVGFLTSTSFGHALAGAGGDADAYRRTFTADLAALGARTPLTVRMPLEGAYGRLGGGVSGVSGSK
jgi:SAM-dependent methyltransferase